MDTMKTGSYLAALRKGAGMTQQEVADRLGVSNKTISKWESGGGFPDIAILPALAELYGVTADDILAGETVRGTTGGHQVEQYLARRGELRWRICYAVAALCLLAGVLFAAVLWVACLTTAAAAAAIWIGWGSCPKDAVRRRIAMLLPCGVMLVWILSYYVFACTQLPYRLLTDYPNGHSVVYYLHDFFRWDLTLLLLPPTLAYAATDYPSYFQSYEALEQNFSATLAFLRVPWITFAVTILALIVTAVVSRRKQDAE